MMKFRVFVSLATVLLLATVAVGGTRGQGQSDLTPSQRLDVMRS